jgi:HD domain
VNLRSHCEVGERLGTRLRLPARLCKGLWFVFERWDGKGMPAGVAGEEIPIAARILHAARDASAFAAAGGPEMVVGMAERCAGDSLDPSIGALLCEHAGELLERVSAVDAWERVVAAEPRPRVFIGDELAQASQVIADYADLKSYGTLGHSRAVADVAEAAGWRLGFEAEMIGEAFLSSWRGHLSDWLGVPDPAESVEDEASPPADPACFRARDRTGGAPGGGATVSAVNRRKTHGRRIRRSGVRAATALRPGGSPSSRVEAAGRYAAARVQAVGACPLLIRGT